MYKKNYKNQHVKIKGSERAAIIQNKKTFIKIDKKLEQEKGEDDTMYQERLYQKVFKAKQRTKKIRNRKQKQNY